jgi:hypothetical protein
MASPAHRERDMPPVSKAQNRLMQAVKNNPKLGKQLGVAPSVAQDFTTGLLAGSVKKLPNKVKPKGK